MEAIFSLKLPPPHGLQVIDPVADWYVPAWQLAQLVEPVTAWK